MSLSENISLKPYNTFGIDVCAKSFCNVSSVEDLNSILKEYHSKPLFILGGGSNMLLTEDIDALVLHINIQGKEVVKETQDYVEVRAMAGENWHSFVLWCIENDFRGVENLSLIPGNVGTAPIQNIGAYGVELKDVFVSCEAICVDDQSVKTFSKADCKFGYRESVFKQEIKGKYVITTVTLRLTKSNHSLNLNYGAIKDVLNASEDKTPNIKAVSEAVVSIRQSKLPDPKNIGNSGSFFNVCAKYLRILTRFK